MKKLLLLYILINRITLLWPEVEIGAIPALVYEYYDTPNLILDDNGEEITYVAISKILSSITTQFIWKSGRNLLLFNMEFLGSLGSLEGSFGKDGKLSGQIKADTFYMGYFRDSPIYIKFGKYPAPLPFGFGTMITTGQVELGYDTDKVDLFYSGIFYSIFNEYNEDGSYSYKSETFNDDNIYLNILGTDMKWGSSRLSIRIPSELRNSDLFNSIYPSIHMVNRFKFVDIDSFIAAAYRDEVTTWGLREELSLKYSSFTTQLLGAHLTGNSSIDESYNFTSVDNKNLDFHYGTHFNYLYQQAANIYGMNSIGLKQSWVGNSINLWLSGSGHFSVKSFSSENRSNSYIGTILSGGFKWNNLWSENTLLEIYTSYFIPGGFSVIDEKQTRDPGFQLVIKLHHIIF